VSDCSLTPT